MRVTEEQAKELLELVRYKVWAFTRGRAAADSEDVVQELVTRVLEQLPQFDETRATLRTYQNRLIERALIDHLRREEAAKRGRRSTRRAAHRLGELADGQGDCRRRNGSRSQIERCDLEMDLESATAVLEPEQQQLCNQIKRKPITEVADDEGVVRGTIYRRLRPIREVFDSLGLAKYLD